MADIASPITPKFPNPEGRTMKANLLEETPDAKVYRAGERAVLEAVNASAGSWTTLTGVLTAGKYVKNTDGTEATNAGYDYYTFALDGGEKLRLSARVGLAEPAVYAFYDQNGAFISAVAGPAVPSRTYNYYPVTAPLTARAAKVSILTGTGAQLALQKLTVATRLNDTSKAAASMLRYESVSFSTVTGKYIQLSDGSIQNSASFNYIERVLDGTERGIKITVSQQLANVAFVAWYDATGAFISGTGGTGGTVVPLTNFTVTAPANARLMRVTGVAAGAFDIKVLDVASNVADRLDAATSDVAAAKSALLAWQAPAVTTATGKYIQLSDGSIQNSASFTYAEYAITGTEQAIRISTVAQLSNVAYVAWYDAGGAFISGLAGPAAGSTTYTQQVVAKPANAAKLRVTNATSFSGTLLIETQDFLAGTGDKVLANTNDVATAKAALAGYASLALTANAGKYINYADGTVATTAGWAYYEAAIPSGVTSLRVSGMVYLTNVAWLAFYNGSTYQQAGSVAGSNPKRQLTDQIIAVPAGATKVRLSVPEAGFVDIQALSLASSLSSRLESVEPQRAATAYSFDFNTGTALATVTADVDYFIPVVGTSWSGGYNQEAGDTAVSTAAVDSGYALMFNAGAYPNGAAVSGYVDLLEQTVGGNKETPCSGIASVLLTGLQARLGFKPRLILAVGGKTGNAYAGGSTSGTGNKRGSDAYKEVLRLVDRAVKISASQGRRLIVPSIVALIGENELAFDKLRSERQFIDNMRQWRRNLEDDIRALTGQRNAIPFVTYQTTWTESRTFGRVSPIQSAQLKVHDRDPLIFQVGAVYDVEEDTPQGHTLARWTRRLGRRFGKVILEAIFGPHYVPLQVIDAWWSAADKFRLRWPEFLALEGDDTKIVLSTLANPAGKGVEFDDGSTSPPTITGAAIATASGTGSISGTTLTIASPSGPIYDNDQVTGAGVTAGTVIRERLTGTTWRVSISQTVASTMITTTSADVVEFTLSAIPTGPRRRALIAARMQTGGTLGRAYGGRSGIRSASALDTDPLDGFVSYKWAMAEEVKL